jgi:hypothetical protein
MPVTCVVPNCRSGYRPKKTGETAQKESETDGEFADDDGEVSMHRFPTDPERLSTWGQRNQENSQKLGAHHTFTHLQP